MNAPTRPLTPDELSIALAHQPDPQRSPRIAAANERNAGFALDKLRREDLPAFFADYMARRFGRMPATITLQDAARMMEMKR